MPISLLGVNKKNKAESTVESTVNERSNRMGIWTNNSQEQSMDKPTDCSGLPEWKQRMMDKNEAAKKEVIDIMDDSMERVMAKIERKPEDQRGQAVENYVSAVDWIMWSVKTVINGVR
ncbi:hypothetical protein LTR70_009689 [Exophiala xenobiotica]|nr:hypothetical protein LTR70_009689 [Exophiala xenobiotica]